MAAPFAIRSARTLADIAEAARLFGDYAASLSVDLAYQDFARELADLPGAYAPPAGELLLAWTAQGEAVGCVAMRPMAAGCCEMKRLYVAPAGRGAGLGRAMVEAIMQSARDARYREMRLDTLPEMTAAIALYRQVGFEPVAPYYVTPIAGTLFLARPL